MILPNCSHGAAVSEWVVVAAVIVVSVADGYSHWAVTGSDVGEIEDFRRRSVRALTAGNTVYLQDLSHTSGTVHSYVHAHTAVRENPVSVAWNSEVWSWKSFDSHFQSAGSGEVQSLGECSAVVTGELNSLFLGSWKVVDVSTSVGVVVISSVAAVVGSIVGRGEGCVTGRLGSASSEDQSTDHQSNQI